MDENELSIRPTAAADRSRLATLIHFGPYTHQHLDWKAPLEWIGSRPNLVLEQTGDIVATLTCPPEVPGIAWIRLFTVSAAVNVRTAWHALWRVAAEEVARMGEFAIAAISIQGWFNNLLESSDFIHHDDVIVLIRDQQTTLPAREFAEVSIREMTPEDLPVVVALDNAAFGTVWRNSSESLGLAFQQSKLATVAMRGSEMVGYQFSTVGAMGGHLARLAVKPGYQNCGIGYMVLRDLINQFYRQGVMHVTVNTQRNNRSSLALYARAGFSLTGESYRVYQYSVQS